MQLFIAFTILAADLNPIPLDGISIERARVLHGQTVTASVLVGRPTYVLSGRTMAGTAERDDGIERGVVLQGQRFNIRQGERLTVRGTMRLIEHRGGIVNGVFTPAWFEIRVEEVK